VVGLGCLFPGARGPDELWARAVAGQSAVREGGPRAPAGVRAAEVAGSAPDAGRHQLPPALAAGLDPLVLQLVEAALDALADAGIDLGRADRGRVSVVVGTGFGGDHAHALLLALRVPEAARALEQALLAHGAPPARARSCALELEDALRGVLPGVTGDAAEAFTASTLASRLAKRLDVHGGCFAVDAACASSLVALEAAVESLRAGDTDLVLCAGADRALRVERLSGLGRAGVLSVAGRTDPLGAEAEGLVPGEGVGVVVLERLAGARAAGRRVHAVVCGVGTASDGETRSAYRPGALGVERALRRAYADARVAPSAASFVEVHGASVPSVDQAEALALRAVFAERAAPLPLATGKAELGHGQASAGMAGLLRAVMALRHGVAAPGLAPRVPHPELGGAFTFAAAPLERERGVATVGVTAIGWGGAHAHAVLQAPPPSQAAEPAVRRAPSREALLAMTGDASRRPEEWAAGSRGGSGPIGLAVRPGPGLAERLAQAAGALRSGAEASLAGAGIAVADGPVPEGLCLLFPGQGAQYAGMMREVAGAYPEAAAVLAACDRILARRGEAALSRVLWAGAAPVDHVQWTPLAMLAGDLMMAAVARAHGLEPSWVTGHSFGEYPALVAAGALDLETAIDWTLVRSRILEDEAPGGGMLAVLADRETTRAQLDGLPGPAYVSNVNGPAQAVVAGVPSALDALEVLCAERGLETRRLAVARPFHSPLMQAAADLFAPHVTEGALRPPRLRVLSTIGSVERASPAELRAGLQGLLTEPVDFVAQVERAYAAGCGRFVEAGPGNVLSRLVSAILAGRPHVSVSLDDRKSPGLEAVERALLPLRAVEGAPRAGRGAPVRFFDATRRRLDETARPLAGSAHASGPHDTPGPGGPRADVRRFLLDLVVAHTGYPPESVGFDLDLEADLGVDSIKQALILGSVRERFGLRAEDRLSLRAFPTLERLVDHVVAAPRAADGRGGPGDAAAVRRYVPRLSDAPLDAAPAGRYRPERLLLVGQGPVARALADALGARGSAVPTVSLEGDGVPAVAEVERVLLSSPADLGLVLSADSDPARLEAVYQVVQRWAARRPPMGGAGTVFVVSQGGGGLASLLKSLARETEGLRVKALHAHPLTPPPELARALVDELDADDPRVEVAWRGGRRQVAGLSEAPCVRDAARAARLAALRCVVVTGGARGITAEAAVALARAGASRLHLVGRTDWPRTADAEIARTVSRIAEAGGVARYHVADVADQAAVSRVLEQVRAEDGPIEAIVHGAGVGRSQALAAKPLADLRAALGPKVEGTRHLVHATRHDPLAFFVAFSSVAGRFGSAGRADYALASALQSRLVAAFAAERPGCRFVSLEWPAWDEVGMAARDDARAHLRGRGQSLMARADGVARFLDELAAAGDDPVVTFASPAHVGDVEGLLGGAAPLPAPRAATLPLCDALREEPGGGLVLECAADAEADAFLRDHRIDGTPVLPAVAVLELMAEAAIAAGLGPRPVLEDVELVSLLRVPPGERRRLACAVARQDDGARITLTEHGRTADVLARGRARPARAGEAAGAVSLSATARERRPTEAAGGRVGRGPALECLLAVWVSASGDAEADVRARPAAGLRASRPDAAWVVPAPALEGVLQACGLVARERLRAPGLPSRFGRLRLGRPPRADERGRARVALRQEAEAGLRFDFALLGDDGEPILQVDGYEVRAARSLNAETPREAGPA
jgi:enediyne polyketide synthase